MELSARFVVGTAREKTPAKLRQAFVDRMTGMEGSAFLVATLLALQEAPVSVCNLFHGELGSFGLFNEQGVPFPNYHTLMFFRELLNTPKRVETGGFDRKNLFIAAGYPQIVPLLKFWRAMSMPKNLSIASN